jgi:putative endonuclease
MTSTEKRKQAHRFGLTAEKLAVFYLRCKCYRILSERYRNHQGEIDIVAVRGDTLVAVEVKARRTMEGCEETVTPLKQQRVARAMEGLLCGQGEIAGLARRHARNIRFDVIWVAPGRLPKHIKDAWRM